MSEEINIYVADLAAYNAGKLHGIWIDATLEVDEIYKQIREMLAASPEPIAEEFAIHDFEGFGSYRLSEWAGIEYAHDIACFIEEYPDFGDELLNYLTDLEEAKKLAEEGYAGRYETVEKFAEELTAEITDVPERLAYYIDYEAMGRDMELSGDIFTINPNAGEVHIFWSH